MVDNKKVVKGFVAGAALTGAFIAPATAQAADTIETPFDMMDGIQNAEATQARQEARKERDRARGKARTFHDLNKKKNVYNVKNNNYQKQLKKYNNGESNKENLKKAENQLKTAQKNYQNKLDNLFVDKSGDKELKNARGSYNKALKEHGKLKKTAEKTKQQKDIDAAKQAKQKFQEAKQAYSSKLDAAKNGITNNDLYKSLMVEGNQRINAQKQAEKKYEAVVAQEWGGWTKEHEVRDRTEDAEFQKLMPEFQKLVQKERLAVAAEKVSAQKLDASKLFLKNDHDVRVWFINEGAGYRNELAYEAFNGDNYEKGMIFDDVSCKSGCQLNNGKNAPLDIGDFVDLGLIEGGTQLNFLLRADGADGTRTSNGDIYGSEASLNADNLQHLMAFAVQAGGRDYLLMGFEDLRKGGDKDYNDAMFVVDLGEDNLTDGRKFAQAAKVPEASNMAAILGVTGAGLMLRRRRRNKKSVTI
ncbi:MAG: DUF4114 domain-containing protein [Rivularia sp. (in: Bacteria)]|nr:DUF4114 domain-containing protein [Rivularia sp. MS3]